MRVIVRNKGALQPIGAYMCPVCKKKHENDNLKIEQGHMLNCFSNI